MSLHICIPASFTYRTVRPCPYCGRRRRFVVTTFVWYGPEAECGGCGNHWSDGERRRLSNKQKALNRYSFQERWAATEATWHDAIRWLVAAQKGAGE